MITWLGGWRAGTSLPVADWEQRHRWIVRAAAHPGRRPGPADRCAGPRPRPGVHRAAAGRSARRPGHPRHLARAGAHRAGHAQPDGGCRGAGADHRAGRGVQLDAAGHRGQRALPGLGHRADRRGGRRRRLRSWWSTARGETDPYDVVPLVATLLVCLVHHRTWQLAEDNARTDPLTGLGNRRRLEEATARMLRQDGPMSVLFLDLDGFKAVNDGRGHLFGDQLLVEIADRLRTGVRSDDLVVRLGGDEFAVLVPGAAAHASVVARRLQVAMRVPVQLTGRPVTVTASIGAATTGTASRPRRGGAAAQRRPGDVPGQGHRPGPGGQLRAGHGRGGHRPRRARRGPGRRDGRRGPAGRALPAGGHPARRGGARLRGAAALAAPHPRTHPAAAVHPHRRADRCDHGAGHLGAPAGHPGRRVRAGRGVRSEQGRGQRLGRAAGRPGLRRAPSGPRWPTAVCPPSGWCWR